MNERDEKRLQEIEVRVREIAEEFGLLTTDILFEIVPAQRVLEGMSYIFPTNFSHWTFGRDFERSRTIYEHTGAGIPYEQVWNFENPRAFLVETNPFALNALILCHVFGHVDFFLGSKFLQHGRSLSDIAEEARQANDRFRRYEEAYGLTELEATQDAGMSIMWQQDPDPFAEDVDEEEVRQRLIAAEKAHQQPTRGVGEFSRKPLTEQDVKITNERLRQLQYKTPPEPMHDILRYIFEHSPKPLMRWQKDVLSVIRHQARHLAPQRRTKILDEGWATYWHVRIMRRLFAEGLITDEEHGIFNLYHSMVLRENLEDTNPYLVGLKIFEYAEDRWDKGQFGKEYERSEDPYKRVDWDTQVGLGRHKIFEMRTLFSDRMAVEQFFTQEFVDANKLYLYQKTKDPKSGDTVWVIRETQAEIIRNALKKAMLLYGQPIIRVESGHHRGKQELYLAHEFTGFELNEAYLKGALENLFFLWGRPVHIETWEIEEEDEHGQPVKLSKAVYSYDGKKHTNDTDDQVIPYTPWIMI